MTSPFFSLSRRLTSSTTGAAARVLRRANLDSTCPPFTRNTAISGSIYQQINSDHPDLLRDLNLARSYSFSTTTAATSPIATAKSSDRKLHRASKWGIGLSRLPPAKPLSFTLPHAVSALVSRPFSSTTEPPAPSGNPGEQEFRHQEIEGPTVEPDNSALANETRQVLEGLRKAIYDLSTVLAALAAVHLAVGAWVSTQAPTKAVLAQGIAAFAFPFVAAFLMRRTLKPLGFFTKMEQMGRLQVLTLALQVSKHIRILFLRVRVLALCCAAGVSVGSVSGLWLH